MLSNSIYFSRLTEATSLTLVFRDRGSVFQPTPQEDNAWAQLIHNIGPRNLEALRLINYPGNMPRTLRAMLFRFNGIKKLHFHNRLLSIRCDDQRELDALRERGTNPNDLEFIAEIIKANDTTLQDIQFIDFLIAPDVQDIPKLIDEHIYRPISTCYYLTNLEINKIYQTTRLPQVPLPNNFTEGSYEHFVVPTEIIDSLRANYDLAIAHATICPDKPFHADLDDAQKVKTILSIRHNPFATFNAFRAFGHYLPVTTQDLIQHPTGTRKCPPRSTRPQRIVLPPPSRYESELFVNYFTNPHGPRKPIKITNDPWDHSHLIYYYKEKTITLVVTTFPGFGISRESPTLEQLLQSNTITVPHVDNLELLTQDWGSIIHEKNGLCSLFHDRPYFATKIILRFVKYLSPHLESFAFGYQKNDLRFPRQKEDRFLALVISQYLPLSIKNITINNVTDEMIWSLKAILKRPFTSLISLRLAGPDLSTYDHRIPVERYARPGILWNIRQILSRHKFIESLVLDKLPLQASNHFTPHNLFLYLVHDLRYNPNIRHVQLKIDFFKHILNTREYFTEPIPPELKLGTKLRRAFHLLRLPWPVALDADQWKQYIGSLPATQWQQLLLALYSDRFIVNYLIRSSTDSQIANLTFHEWCCLFTVMAMYPPVADFLLTHPESRIFLTELVYGQQFLDQLPQPLRRSRLRRD